jgi:hypothetical protein
MLLGSNLLEVALGLIFIYFLLSLMCSALAETFSRFFALRANNLQTGIKAILQENEGLVQAFNDHPLIKGISHRGFADHLLRRQGGPSYIARG